LDITVAGFKAGSQIVRAVPAPVMQLMARGAGASLAQLQRDRRNVVARNLKRVMGPDTSRFALSRAVDTAFESYARYYLESLRLPGLSAETVDAGLAVEGYVHLEEGLAAGKGVILALPHLGGWEWAGRWVADQGHGITAVVEPLELPELFEWFTEMRAALGMTVVPLGPTAGSTVMNSLRANHVVCLLSDRDIGGGGIPVTFFGETTRLPAGPATLALRTGAPILPTAVYFTGRGDGHFGLVRPPLSLERTGRFREEVARVTQELATELEVLIRRAPEQWHLFQPNWPSDPGYRQ
jgi:KDO2-lipid IV(A) lauroyltransferase